MTSQLSTESGPELPEQASQRRGYDAPRRRAQASQTRAEIVAAARQLFAERGWAATTVRDIARAAQVSEPTVYSAYGGKSGLAVALIDGIDPSVEVATVRSRLAASDEPADQLAALVGYDRALFERSGDVLLILREAGRTEPELAAAYERGRARGEEVWRRVFTGWPRSAFARGVTVDNACDSYAAICNVDVFTTLRTERGWSADQVERWWHDVLVKVLLGPQT
ncbi:TetR/AcrR family transcriptional regulator [Kribbella sp. NPDC056345]|uniref:TetR/AcrR family transcriptional regulator n=1 Tax=Kribbella sp. NPDC056345 TaxID=3345789 RepID=UPI0035DAF942